MARPEKRVHRETRGSRRVTAPRGSSLVTAFEQHQATAVDSLLRLLGDPLASFLTWAVIAIALALPLSLLLGSSMCMISLSSVLLPAPE